MRVGARRAARDARDARRAHGRRARRAPRRATATRALFGRKKDKTARDAIDLSKRRPRRGLGRPRRRRHGHLPRRRRLAASTSSADRISTSSTPASRPGSRFRSRAAEASAARASRAARRATSIRATSPTSSSRSARTRSRRGWRCCAWRDRSGTWRSRRRAIGGTRSGRRRGRGATGEILGRDPTPLMGDTDRVGL